MPTMPPMNFKAWVDENKHLLKPPVGNKYLYQGENFFVMVVGGPNARKDFHVNQSEEFFYQVKGDIRVGIREDGKTVYHVVREGDVFFVPPNVPHSPQRPADTVGIVVERTRRDSEIDHLWFFCEKCGEKMHDIEFNMKDIVQQLKSAMEAYWSDTTARTCRKCGSVMEKPEPCKAV